MASLSSYQFTRRAWRREVFELFIDSAFFQATAPALHSWCAVVDNLMTQEKNTFKEALSMCPPISFQLVHLAPLFLLVVEIESVSSILSSVMDGRVNKQQ